ncbi:nitroreductase family deazaflavin-dependent oxidoreductase [Actinotalea sp. Marseille-Q4924]|uniref:nitroreductase family deazaflavin-dependent oxidoreductase n=1 Tax=Actinotalea sp. Marseille-Q4924 TaxID=2866571 RepID=UPI001CE47CF9|nr:nitroreductase family deazaflavin-dependent oxidoreductase [Actinotalea sp. Marseille-Q4924]
MINRRVQVAVTAAHRWLYRRTGGRVGARLGHIEQVLLTTTGRVSGQPRVTVLSAIQHGDDLLLVASDGGRESHPQWYRNLVADDRVVVQRGPRRVPMRARTATPQERPELWRAAVGVYGGYATYQTRTQREIPVVVCSPDPGRGAADATPA